MIPIVRVTLKPENYIMQNENYIFGCEEAAPIFIEEISECAREVISMICLNAQNEILNYSVISLGKVDKVSVDYNVLLTTALLSCAKFIIIGHNHPSNNLKPSQVDIDTTKNIGKLCKIVDVELLDSLIVTPEKKWLSIRSYIKNKGDKFNV
ncbi:hypothetical protein ERX35_000025 [Macrococcus equipercicus]|uniref:MPN domain-containing protein n=1 Tax=Macrococcus equipercicus TaxID=69967 RepID=A0ABQ6RAP4_9STAP|nr:JAB domain-containing protein [Macrococcus equipercicus]KAA1042305.1 hypothetical protein ERX35_000025 [Macrococcus equipercicus]